MLLTIDVGNTNMHFGLFKGEDLVHDFRLNSKADRTVDELGIVILNMLEVISVTKEDVTGVLISSVVPNITSLLNETFEKYFTADIVKVGPGSKTGISVQTENPKEVGADRIVNVAAAHEIYKRSCIVIDFGTATTFDYVDAEGVFRYTVIMPGLNLAAQALFRGTAKLPDVEIIKPDSILASNTVTGMQAGIVYGYIGAVRYTIQEQMKALGDTPLVIATGGIAKTVVNDIKEIEIVNPDLALEGMKIIYKKTKGIRGDLVD